MSNNNCRLGVKRNGSGSEANASDDCSSARPLSKLPVRTNSASLVGSLVEEKSMKYI